MVFRSIVVAWSLAVLAVRAIPLGVNIVSHTSNVPCTGNSASDRSVWCDHDIHTDYYNVVPDTGVTREYWLELVNVTAAPDGVPRTVLTVNGTVPGPTLYADWGDRIKVHVHNGLENNGTSMHFHGVRQNNTNTQDGVSSITQCPVAPGESITYEWRATEYGSTWYHSHFALQAWGGVFGGIIINGPASANYDEDAGVLFLNDWDHRTVDSLYQQAQISGQPWLQTGLINGTNVWVEESDGEVVGSRFEMTVSRGKSYRLRIYSAAIGASLRFMIDNHVLMVIAADLVPIQPYNTTSLLLVAGQRYDVIVTANQDAVASDFWIRSIPQVACSKVHNVDNIKGILHYGTGNASTPTTSPWNFTDSCLDEPASSLVPIVPVDASPEMTWNSEMTNASLNADGLIRWSMGPTSFKSEWDNPTLLQVANGTTVWPEVAHVVPFEGVNEWIAIEIQAGTSEPHPIHLHGHDVLILASGTGQYVRDNVSLQLHNPPRRDTVMLPGDGYMVIAFQTNNPGAWLLHCHIGWHQAEGYAMQFLVRYAEIESMIDTTALETTCRAWDRYMAIASPEDDSGI
ncbi:hypothetical protein ASPZODRAFT_110537 [Penicilliopsis zonata CBS 506.65]|uniref:Laccase n=1 Tax=Penicilliopsis zonata CBS 506.65 TaxID=1073090 RepID=A0A1L9ST75_9EURO|nr:hypothetical protein ASPZODRAFT_110537 [Penicilliopsis zonata CBS 506.65]OJJ50277.1 hypothetical protein ASPZODRAFT_110537 [Penicilliopsis zonata CBS 506.65]